MINPFSKLQRRSKMIPTGSYSPFLVLSDGKTLVNNTVDIDYAELNSDIFSVIFRVSSDCARVKFKAKNPQYQKVLDNPTNLINAYGFKQMIFSQMMFTGNGYASIHKNGNQIPDELEQLPVSWLSNIVVSQNNITYTVTPDDSERKPFTLDETDILHFRLFTDGSTTKQYAGISPLVSLAKEVNIQSYSNDLSLTTLKNAIAPSYTLTIPEGTLDREAKENIRKAFESQNSGSNAGRAIVLDQGLQLNKIDINPDIAKLLNNTTFTQTQIAKAFCIPDSYLNGQGDQQSSVEMLKSFYINALPIYIEPVVSELEAKFGIDIEADIASAIDVDHSQLISNLKDLAGSLGSLNVQQILKSKGIFPDIQLQNLNLGSDSSNAK